ncbi:hypothetical protein FSP39_001093 [Pinctada imbricata]|uniref:Zinc finger matrin-type protein 5 n=1 Tax=Pinctada imbricata TaxID=66713 RepID=A0AA89BYH9_PINIB|nr:hypothetical protein FSP39_001093 [Pinctada imbricata]
MGRRYYCDFCDKSFADNPTSRKNHLKGLQHQRIRKSHYDAFREPEVILQEEQTKRPCKIYLTKGTCQFQDNCRFSHLTEERRNELERQIEEKSNKKRKLDEGNDGEEAKKLLDSWLEEYHKNHQGDKVKEKVEPEPIVLPHYILPPHLAAVPNVPFSLLPPPPDAFQNLQYLDWG